ncbi:hypothetical protein [Pseudomonas sp. RL_15y_Pfl2_60]|uniref:hypothetical protein n=1 Tax=Pseudomonas sp. RL_15y_Pfl2_60 TaxID=3088709 RepID=UPI0030DB26E3
MKPYLIFASTLFTFSMLFSQFSQAEESASFVARNERVQEQANSNAQRETLAKQSQTASKQESEATKDS